MKLVCNSEMCYLVDCFAFSFSVLIYDIQSEHPGQDKTIMKLSVFFFIFIALNCLLALLIAICLQQEIGMVTLVV